MPKQPETQPQQTAIVAFPDTTKDEAKELIAEAIEAAKRGEETTIVLPDKSKPWPYFLCLSVL